MKRNVDQALERLGDALPAMPQDCRDALMRAACSVKEERAMKKLTLRTALIAALLLILTVTAALAATEAMGWTDFFSRYDGTSVPQAAQTIMNASETKTYEVGPLTFTVKQMLSDGSLAMAAADIRTTDGSAALYCYDPGDTLGCNGLNGQALAQRLGLPPETTYLDAARKLNLPLYFPTAALLVDQAYDGGEAMEDPLWNEDNTMTYFSIALLNPEKTKGLTALPTTLLLSVRQIDLETGKAVPDSVIQQQEALEIPVHGVFAEKDYAPAAPFSINGYTLLSVHAEQTVCGLYLDRAYEADAEAQKLFESDDSDEWEIIEPLWNGVWRRENGDAFPEGMSLTGSFESKDFPVLHFYDMISADEMPEVLILDMGEQQVTLK